MSNVIQFPPMVKQQVFSKLAQAKAYAQAFMLNDQYATANIVDTDDGRYIVTVFPHDDLMAQAVKNMRKEYGV
jgi:hypothetical protein